MTRMMVHDLRGPIAGVMGALELLGGVPAMDNGNRKLLDAAEKNTRRQLKLVEGILELARLEEGALFVQREEVPLAVLVDEVLQTAMPAAQARGLELISEVPETLPGVLADPGLVARILENLIGNAVKFSQPGAGPIRVSARLAGTMVELLVHDSGPGVEEKLRPRIFEKFVVGNHTGRGSGLGLAFCRLAVEAQGGRIRLEHAGPGAVFAFSLPLASASGRLTPGAAPVLEGLMRRALPVLLLVLATLACRRPPAADPAYAAEIGTARALREKRLASENGWLTLVALHWLTPGENAVGSDPAAPIALEAPGVPPKAAAFDLRPDGSVHLRAEPGAPVAVNGAPPTDAPLVSDRDGKPDVVTVGRVRLTVIERGGRLAVRARDPESPRRTSFAGLQYFPVDPVAPGRSEVRAVRGLARHRRAVGAGPAAEGLRSRPRPVHDRRGRAHSRADRRVAHGRHPLLRLQRRDRRHRHVRRGTIPLCREAEGRGDPSPPRLQPRREPALRLHALRHLPSCPPEERPAGEDRGWREGARRALTKRSPALSLLCGP